MDGAAADRVIVDVRVHPGQAHAGLEEDIAQVEVQAGIAAQAPRGRVERCRCSAVGWNAG